MQTIDPSSLRSTATLLQAEQLRLEQAGIYGLADGCRDLASAFVSWAAALEQDAQDLLGPTGP